MPSLEGAVLYDPRHSVVALCILRRGHFTNSISVFRSSNEQAGRVVTR